MKRIGLTRIHLEEDAGKSAERIVEDKGLIQISDEAEIATLVEEILRENPDQVSQYKKGKERLLGFFVGQVMKKTQCKAHPRLANEILKKAFNKGRTPL